MIKNPISYPGNKNRLLNQIIPYFPCAREIVDVFCGSGVVGVNTSCKKILLNDNCSETITIIKYLYETKYEIISKSIENIIKKYGLTDSRNKPRDYYIIHNHEGLSKYNKCGYNALKSSYNESRKVEELLVLLIYGFNHYIRFSKKGDFNVPVGKVDFSASIDKQLETFVNGIKNKDITFTNFDFREKTLYIENAVFYFDPPYLITVAPYNSNWTDNDERDLLGILDELDKQHKLFLLSNVFLSNGKRNVLLEKWSKKYNVIFLKRQYRNANYRKKNLSDTIEVLIKNF